jgi:predicted regulator of Ras-like GTPase activity (Roadblock/LC7/MglB family)
MTPVMSAWLVSSVGAMLFFAAGSLFALRASTVRARGEHTRREAERAELERALAERERLQGVAAEAERQRRTLAALAKERDRLRASQAAIEESAREANARADQAWRELAEVVEQLRSKRKREASQRPALPDSGARGEALRAILERETSGGAFAGAVITDGLGLVVAARGEHAEALAAYGAFLAGVGAKARAALPLGELRQLTLQDENDTLLSVRPIASAEDDLALVTLTGFLRDAPSASSNLER